MQASENPRGAVFVTPESLMTFPVAALVVSVVWQVCQKVFNLPMDSYWVPAVTATCLGVMIIMISVSKTKPKNALGWCVLIVVTMVNVVFLIASALGISVGTGLLLGSLLH